MRIDLEKDRERDKRDREVEGVRVSDSARVAVRQTVTMRHGDSETPSDVGHKLTMRHTMTVGHTKTVFLTWKYTMGVPPTAIWCPAAADTAAPAPHSARAGQQRCRHLHLQ